MLSNAVVLPLYNLFDSGINSPDTIYIIAPAAIEDCNNIFFEILPATAPKMLLLQLLLRKYKHSKLLY